MRSHPALSSLRTRRPTVCNGDECIIVAAVVGHTPDTAADRSSSHPPVCEYVSACALVCVCVCISDACVNVCVRLCVCMRDASASAKRCSSGGGSGGGGGVGGGGDCGYRITINYNAHEFGPGFIRGRRVVGFG